MKIKCNLTKNFSIISIVALITSQQLDSKTEHQVQATPTNFIAQTQENNIPSQKNRAVENLTPKASCQATVDKVIQEIMAKGVKRVGYRISKGTANEGKTGNPTNRTDKLIITLSSWNKTYTTSDQRSDKILFDIMNSTALMKNWTDRIVSNCSNTAIVSFGQDQTDYSMSYYIQSDSQTKLMECLHTDTPPSIIPWGKEWGPQCG